MNFLPKLILSTGYNIPQIKKLNLYTNEVAARTSSDRPNNFEFDKKNIHLSQRTYVHCICACMVMAELNVTHNLFKLAIPALAMNV